MIRINQLKLPITHSQKELEDKIYECLKIKRSEKLSYEIIKKSIDARKKPQLFYIYAVWVTMKNENTVVKKAHNPNVALVKKVQYQAPTINKELLDKEAYVRPIVIGAGPAGLFAAYIFALAGCKPIVIERGKSVEQRKEDVEEFWEKGILNPSSNVQYGEGGAGTFSDGKLNTVVKDPSGRNRFVLETFVKFGAPEQILYDNKPHIGTDVLMHVVANMRNEIITLGGEFHFETKMIDFTLHENRLNSIVVQCEKNPSEQSVLAAKHMVLAIGHSARDTFRMLLDKQIEMQQKNFAVGFRVEHPQAMINEAMYGQEWASRLPASPYKVTSNFPNGRGVYSFCMCPGGYVVNASSDQNQSVVNGMSYSGRNSKNANSAIIISVDKKDFGSDAPLAGMEYQIALEKKAYEIGNGAIPQQLFGDYVGNKVSTSYGAYESEMKGAHCFANLRGLFSEDMEQSFIEGMQHFSHIIPNYDRKDAILSAVESRTSSPVRIVRDECFESNQKGIFPCGEGAGYAGGITSAAMDGMKVAEAVIANYALQ